MTSQHKLSAKKPTIELIDSWIKCVENDNGTDPNYVHQLISLEQNCDESIWEQLFQYIKHAHSGAIETLRAPLKDTLHPCDYGTEKDPALGYPHHLDLVSLQGFFGEILAGIIAENYVNIGEHDWEVPIHLFKFHLTAFQSLELAQQTGDFSKKVFGRTGDDGLAFSRNKKGEIVAWLAIEAKCTGDHSSELISANHQKLSSIAKRPIDLLRLIEAFDDYEDDEYSQEWARELRNLWLDRKKEVSRFDLSVYVCGKKPTRKSTWICTNKCHQDYTGNRDLCSTEFHFSEVLTKIRLVYDKWEK